MTDTCVFDRSAFYYAWLQVLAGRTNDGTVALLQPIALRDAESWRNWAATVLVRGFRLPDAEARALLENDYNPRCGPPWEGEELDREFAHKLAEARTKPFGKRVGWLLHDEPKKGVDLTEFLDTPPDTPKPGIAAISVGELVRANPILRPPVIRGLLREGETKNVIAAPKTGKSWLTLDLAISVATGRPWLGQYETVPGDVLIIDNELHRETSAHRVPKVAQARGVPMSEIAERIYIDNLRGRLTDIARLATYTEALEPGRFKVIVLDAFYRFMPAGGDENDNGLMANIYNTIDAIADRLRCCFVMIHHASKGSQASKNVTDVGAGAGAQSRATDTHLVLRPHEEEGVVVLDAGVRSWSPVKPACLRWEFPVWTVDDDLDPTALRNERAKKKTAITETKVKPDRWTPERFVETFIGEELENRIKIREAAMLEQKISRRRVDELFVLAEEQGLIERVKLPGRGAPIGFRIAITGACE